MGAFASMQAWMHATVLPPACFGSLPAGGGLGCAFPLRRRAHMPSIQARRRKPAFRRPENTNAEKHSDSCPHAAYDPVERLSVACMHVCPQNACGRHHRTRPCRPVHAMMHGLPPLPTHDDGIAAVHAETAKAKKPDKPIFSDVSPESKQGVMGAFSSSVSSPLLADTAGRAPSGGGHRPYRRCVRVCLQCEQPVAPCWHLRSDMTGVRMMTPLSARSARGACMPDGNVLIRMPAMRGWSGGLDEAHAKRRIPFARNHDAMPGYVASRYAR